MLILLKELLRFASNGSTSEERDRTINPEQVIDIAPDTIDSNACVIKCSDGIRIVVRGSVEQITRRLNGLDERRLIKSTDKKKRLLND